MKKRFSNPERFIVNGMLANSSRILSSGVFLTGYMLLLDADDLLIGLLGSVNAWTLLLSLVSSFVVERTRHRKRLLLGVICAMRLLSCLPILLPLWMGFSVQTARITVSCILLGHCVFSVHTTDANLYMLDTLGTQQSGTFLYRRMQFIRSMELVCLLLGGMVIDCLSARYEGYLVVFGIALLFGVGDVMVFCGIHGQTDVREGAYDFKGFLGQIWLPLKHKRYRGFVLFSLFFFTCFYTVIPYQTLYLLKYVALPTSYITAFQTAQIICIVLSSRLWGRVEVRKGSAWVLKVNAILLSLDFGLYALVRAGQTWPLLIAIFSTGIPNGGF